MATPTYTPIASITLGSSASSVEFSSIPQDYRDLVLVFDISFPSDSEPHVRFNSDSGSNYSVVSMDGDGTGTSSASQTRSQLKPAISAFTAFWGSLNIMDYTATDKHKTVLARSNNVGEHVAALATRWADTSAITNIEITTSNAAQYSAGTTFALYGIAS